MPSTKSPAENSGTTTEKYDGFTAEERAAMKEHAQEQKKTTARRGSSRAEKEAAAEQDVLAKIAEMPETDRVLAERIHEIVKTVAPDLAPKLWYGMPAYARDGKVICFFRSGATDKERYSTFGFTPEAQLDDESGLWPTSYAVTRLGEEAEKAITALVRKAAG